MQHRNLSSFLRSLCITCLTVATLAPVAPALAESADNPSLFSLTMPSLSDTSFSAADDVLTVQEIRVPPQLPNTIDLTTKSTNLWERIRNGFAMTNLNDDLVLYYQQWYQNRPDALRRMVERSRPYLHYIVDELEARGMPTELALLPMVESSFNPNAYSPAHAAGLWQFIPATGKRFNLEQNWWRDERRDILASTGAALDYLQTIYEMHGDWHLALASYNWGEGAVKRAIVKNESRGLPTDYPNLTMPNETRHYVPKLQALKNILGNPAMIARLELPFIPNEPYFATHETRRPIDVKTAARLANMSLEEFLRLNPSHNRPIIKADTPVVIPADKVDTFRDNLQNNQSSLTQWQAYTVTSAERLDKIAARFDTTASELARVNSLSEKVRLGAGSTVLVPGGSSGAGLSNLLNASGPQHFIEPERVARCGKAGKHAKTSARSCDKPEPRITAKSSPSGGHEATKASGKSAKSGALSGKANSKTGAKAADHGKSKPTGPKPAKEAASPKAKAKPGRRG
ncbi:transglycosylase SLT domain-containing protein [Ferribacterium limneticum]|uniref:transglycosylase SLT domain-containing protein n=1 Tax=Ferribacterium limneticum TaxID=76259 RepID=UPI001CFA3581|nr:transglycosylase SLT domain-containing protein [Ferribacterium limneticum]UCV27169.1 transglycosylase SLT domain-containing protein [Ferribacterium limneticum]UCV31086.1 transglycosylase SLT domain-containing protein [Ferribacterium limneticum]